MALADTITRLFQRFSSPASRTTADEAPPRKRQGMDYQQFKADQGRLEIIRRSREMYEEDTRAKGIIKTLARDAVKGGFTVTANDAAAVDEVTMLTQRLRLQTRLDDWVRLSLRDGDSFLELTVDSDMNIVTMTRKPVIGTHRASNEQDMFDDPTRAFWYSKHVGYAQEPPKDALWFPEWQIIHARWDHDEESRYGTPHFSAGTGAWKRVREGEIDTAVRRKTRSGIKYHHKFPPQTTPEAIKAYRADNQDALSNPLAAITDFFGTTDISILQGDANLGDIKDVLHHLRTWWIGAIVPMSLLGYGEDLNRDVLQEQQEQYLRALEGVSEWVTDEILRPLVERQWMLKGWWPAHLEYDVTWAPKVILTPQMVMQAAQAGAQLMMLGWPADVVNELIAQFMPGVDVSRLVHSSRSDGEPEEMARAVEKLMLRLRG